MWSNIVYPPSADLKPYIACYWIGHIPAGIHLPSMFLPPSGHTGILISFGKKYLQLRNYGGELFTVTRAVVVGPYYNHLEVIVPDEQDVIGILFKPTIFNEFYGLDMHLTTHKMLDAEEVFGSEISPLIDRIGEVESDEKRLGVVEEHFRAKFYGKKPKELRIQAPLQYILDRKGNFRMTDLSDYFRCSNRYLEKRFKEELGVSPKFMGRVVQFNHALSIVKYSPQINWTDLAYRAGYYDQAHLINTFVEFTGVPPIKYTHNDNEITEFYVKEE